MSELNIQFQWSEPPSYAECQEILLAIGKLEAEIELLQFEIKECELPIKRQKPRDVSARDEASIELQRRVTIKKAELRNLLAQEKFLNFHKEVYKAMSYGLRM